MQSNTLKTIGIYALTCFIWGSTWLGIKIGLESTPPIIAAGYRFSLAAILIYTVVALKRIKIQKDKTAIKLYFAMAIFSFVLPYGLIYWAEQFVPSGLTAVLYAVYPFSVAFFTTSMIPSEKIGINKIAGMVVAFTGLYIIFSESFTGNLNNYITGMVVVILSAIMQSAIAVSIKKYGHHLHPLAMNFYPMLIAGLVLTIYGIISGLINYHNNTVGFNNGFSSQIFGIFTYKSILSIFYLALFGSLITFTCYYWLLKRVNIIILSLITFITPVIALFLGWLFYREELSHHQSLGCVLVLTGLLIAIIGNIGKVFYKKT
jgi:drug/metabolite transporter (DMT)-like permease